MEENKGKMSFFYFREHFQLLQPQENTFAIQTQHWGFKCHISDVCHCCCGDAPACGHSQHLHFLGHCATVLGIAKSDEWHRQNRFL
jgi:hypothetical protein